MMIPVYLILSFINYSVIKIAIINSQKQRVVWDWSLVRHAWRQVRLKSWLIRL